MKRRLFSVMLMAVLLLLLAVVAAEASVIPGAGDEGTAPTGFEPPAAPADATGCTATGSGWYGPGQTVSTNTGDHLAVVISVNIPQGNTTPIPTFCTDLVTSIGPGSCFQAAGPTSCPISWLLNNGYGPASNLTNAEAAARQAAVWYLLGQPDGDP